MVNGNPLQSWSFIEKSIRLLAVIKGITGTKEVSGPQVAATFNHYFKQAGKVHPPNVSRDLGLAKVANPAPVGEDKGMWYLTDEGDRQAADLSSEHPQSDGMTLDQFATACDLVNLIETDRACHLAYFYLKTKDVQGVVAADASARRRRSQQPPGVESSRPRAPPPAAARPPVRSAAARPRSARHAGGGREQLVVGRPAGASAAPARPGRSRPACAPLTALAVGGHRREQRGAQHGLADAGIGAR